MSFFTLAEEAASSIYVKITKINTCMYYKSTTTGQRVKVHGVPVFDLVKVSIYQLKIETRSPSKIQKKTSMINDI